MLKIQFSNYFSKRSWHGFLSLVIVSALGNEARSAEAQPSFDCKKAKSNNEKAICKDERLANLDRDLAKIYGASLNAAEPFAGASLRKEQEEWLTSREKCSSDVACISDAYSQRLSQLIITHRDLKYGFEISYPKPMRLNDGKTALNVQWSQVLSESSVGNAGGFLVIEIVAFNPNRSSGSPNVAVRVGVRSGKNIELACGLSTIKVTRDTTLNGHKYHVLLDGGGGMGRFYEVTSYVTFHDGLCFAVQRVHSWRNVSFGTDVYGLKEKLEEQWNRQAEQVYEQNESIIKTFRLTSSGK